MALSDRFFETLRASNEPLYNGCEDHSQLSAVASLVNIKAEHNISESCYNSMVQAFKGMLPRDNSMLGDYYSAKKIMKDLGLSVIKIDCCKTGCMLYWKDDENEEFCKFCEEPRYKPRRGRSHNPKRKKSSQAVLRYLPLTPRLQRLYASDISAEHMSWHANHETEVGVMCHPSDAEAWKNFDKTHSDFALESRNIRLGLCFGEFALENSYSCWPVIVTPYNLPPGMCMKNPYMFLSLIIPGPNNPKKMIDVYMQPLIEELKELWEAGVPTYDVSRKDYFNMRAAIMWSINDFLAYEMLSGWSTAGVLGCPICMEDSKAFHLQHGRKTCYFDCHRRFLPADHPYRKDKKCFTRGRAERDPAPRRLTGSEVWEHLRQYQTVMEDLSGRPPGYGHDHNWMKKSIFWEFPYWKTNMIRHNLDVMHIEKNVFNSVFNTVMDVKGKTNDNLNARKDIKVYCNRPEIAVDVDSMGPIPKAVYTLTKHEKKKICEWLKCLRFPDGYTSNLGRCIDMNECKLIGVNSHDCHVFMERLLPIAFREMLPEFVWASLTELSLFFQIISSVVLNTNQMKELEENVAVILCNLEKIFPPAFSDCMEHLIVHLPFEARVGGPVQYRWMYPFNRFLCELKKKVKNKSCVEVSICQAYIMQETSTFVSHYFEPHVTCKRKRPGRKDEGVNDATLKAFSIFNIPGQPNGRTKSRYVLGKEMHAAHTYILLNCEEVDPYHQMYVDGLKQQGYSAEEIENVVDSQFVQWFHKFVINEANLVTDDLLHNLAWGPSSKVKTFSAYFINGYNFHTLEHGEGKSTMNSGVCVRSSNYSDVDSDFYGLLEEIIQFEFPSQTRRQVVMFKCKWVDPIRGMKIDRKFPKLVDVNHKQLFIKYEPFVLAQQAVQVYYASYPGIRRDKADWVAVCETKARRTIELVWRDLDAYQPDEIGDMAVVHTVNEIPPLNDPNGIILDVELDEAMEPRPQVQGEEEDEDCFEEYTTDEDETDEDDDDDDY